MRTFIQNLNLTETPICLCLLSSDRPYRKALEQRINEVKELNLKGSFRDLGDACADIARIRPDLILVDSTAPGIEGGRAIQLLKACVPGARVIVILGMTVNIGCIDQCLKMGVDGFLDKEMYSETEFSRHLVEAYCGLYPLPASVRCLLVKKYQKSDEVIRGSSALTKRESQVVEFWTRGLTDKEIAAQLNVSFETIKTHAKNLFLKLEVHNRAQACYKFGSRISV